MSAVSDIEQAAMAVELAALGRRAQAERGRSRKPPIPDDVITRDYEQAAALDRAAGMLRALASTHQKADRRSM